MLSLVRFYLAFSMPPPTELQGQDQNGASGSRLTVTVEVQERHDLSEVAMNVEETLRHIELVTSN